MPSAGALTANELLDAPSPLAPARVVLDRRLDAVLVGDEVGFAELELAAHLGHVRDGRGARGRPCHGLYEAARQDHRGRPEGGDARPLFDHREVAGRVVVVAGLRIEAAN